MYQFLPRRNLKLSSGRENGKHLSWMRYWKKNEKVMIIGTFFRGYNHLDGILRSEITRDGMDATDVLVRLIKYSKYYTQIRVIMLDGVTYAGFNPVDITRLFKET